jgi:hypothetical protein
MNVATGLDYAREAQAVAAAPEGTSTDEPAATASTNGTADEPMEALVAM